MVSSTYSEAGSIMASKRIIELIDLNIGIELHAESTEIRGHVERLDAGVPPDVGSSSEQELTI